MADSVQPAPQKSSFGCLKILAILAGVIALVLLIVVVLVWQTISWFKNAPETKIASYPPLTLSAGEQEDVDRILTKVGTAQANKAVVDEYVSPEVFNGVMEKFIEGEKKKSTTPSGPTFVRGGFSGQDLELKFSTALNDPKATQQQYLNVDMIFDCEMEDGKFKVLEIKQLLVHDQPPPFIARNYINIITKALTQGDTQALKNQNGQKNPLEGFQAIKLLKREGNKIHFILDGSKMKPDTQTQTPTQDNSDEKPASGKKARKEKSDDDTNKPTAQPEEENDENNAKAGEKEK